MAPGSCPRNPGKCRPVVPSAFFFTIAIYRSEWKGVRWLLLRRGYREILLFLPKLTNPEDAYTRLGFEEVMNQHKLDHRRYRLIWHDEDRASLTRLVDRLLKPLNEPMAWFIMRPEFYFFIHTYLLYRRIHIPEQIGLICRNMTDYLPEVFPEPARYVTDSYQLGRRFARYVMRALEGHSPGNQRMMAEFTSGGTLRPCNEKPRPIES